MSVSYLSECLAGHRLKKNVTVLSLKKNQVKGIKRIKISHQHFNFSIEKYTKIDITLRMAFNGKY